MKNKLILRIKQIFTAFDTQVKKQKTSDKTQVKKQKSPEKKSVVKKISIDDDEQKTTITPVKRKWPLSWVPPVHLRHPEWSYDDKNT